MNKEIWILALLSLTILACSKDKENPIPPSAPPSTVEAGIYIIEEYSVSKFEKDFEQIVKEGVGRATPSTKATSSEGVYLKSVDVKVNLAYTVDSFQLILDFGNQTLLPSNNRVSGKLILTGAHKKWSTQEVICTYSNFFFNTDQITGRERYTSQVVNKIPTSKVEFDTKIVHPNKTTLTRKGTRITEWTKPSTIYKDNEFRVTGNWESNYSSTNKIIKGSITDPLIIKNACQYKIVDGTIQFAVDGYVIEVDYQNNCSNNVLITLNGKTYPYTLTL